MDMKLYKNLMCLGAMFALLFMGSCEEDQITTNDVQEGLTQSTIDPLTATSVEAGSTFTITGTNLDIVTEVSLSNITVSIASQTATSLTFDVPRIFPIGPVSVTNKYRLVSTTEETLAPIYEDIAITEWPTDFEVGQPIVITGTNVHLINKVVLTIMDVNTDYHPASLIGTAYEVVVNGASSNGTTISVATRGLGIPYGATVVASAAGLSNITGNANSPGMIANKPSDTFVPIEPIVLWDFEDGVNPYQEGDIAANVVGINAGALAIKALGNNYFTLKVNSVPDAWGTWLGQLSMTDIDVSEFNAPHLSFMVNTNGNEGNFQLAVTQGGIQGGKDLTANVTGVEGDDYKIKTTGWEWRSISLEGDYSDWGNGALTFNISAAIEELALSFKQGNGANPFEIHLDHIMITDGPVRPVVIESFEGTVPAFGSKNGGAMNAVHLNDYFHYSYNVTSGWSKQGDVRLEGTLDLGELNQPYLNFWINTGSGSAFFQLVTSQNGVTFGHDPNGYELYQTNGEWQLLSINLSEVSWSNWSSTEDNFDPGAPVEFFQIDFNPGNQDSGLFEFNIDGLILSEGPMFYYPAEED